MVLGHLTLWTEKYINYTNLEVTHIDEIAQWTKMHIKMFKIKVKKITARDVTGQIG